MLKYSRYFLFSALCVVAPNSAKACDFVGAILCGLAVPAAISLLAVGEAALNGVAAGFSGELRNDIITQANPDDGEAKQVERGLLASTVLFSAAGALNLAFAGTYLFLRDRDERQLRNHLALGLSMGAAIANLVGMGLNIHAKSYTNGNQGYANNKHVGTMYGTSLASGISNAVGTTITWFAIWLNK